MKDLHFATYRGQTWTVGDEDEYFDAWNNRRAKGKILRLLEGANWLYAVIDAIEPERRRTLLRLA